MTDRPSWDSLWEEVASDVKWRSLCVRSQVGCVITDAQHRVVSTGYNGPPAGFQHEDRPCRHWCAHAAGDDGLRCVSVHAEANALLSGDRSSWQGGTIYITKHPCWECAKMIANSGLARICVRSLTPQEPKHRDNYSFLARMGMTVWVVD